MRPIGLRTFPRRADRIIGCPKPRASVIRIRLLTRFDWILGFFAELLRYPRCGMCLEHRSSPRRVHFWWVGGALRVQRWCSTSRSAGECVRSQRCFPGWLPVHALERTAHPRGPGRPADRVSVNFLPSTFTLSFGGVMASASLTNFGPAGGFGLIFSSAGDELLLSTAGAGQPFSNFDVSDLAGRLGRVLVAMTADPTRRLSSLDLLDAGEHAGLDGWGNRAVLTQPATPVSVPVVFAAQVARAPEAVALVCGERSWTYRELDEASNRLAH